MTHGADSECMTALKRLGHWPVSGSSVCIRLGLGSPQDLTPHMLTVWTFLPCPLTSPHPPPPWPSHTKRHQPVRGSLQCSIYLRISKTPDSHPTTPPRIDDAEWARYKGYAVPEGAEGSAREGRGVAPPKEVAKQSWSDKIIISQDMQVCADA